MLRDPIFCSISFIMSVKRGDEERPIRELRHGLTHLWNGARGVATTLRKEATGTDVGKAIDHAGRELLRAATNVVEQLAHEGSEIACDAMPCETTDEATAADHPPVSPASKLEGTDSTAPTVDTGTNSAPGFGTGALRAEAERPSWLRCCSLPSPGLSPNSARRRREPRKEVGLSRHGEEGAKWPSHHGNRGALDIPPAASLPFGVVVRNLTESDLPREHSDDGALLTTGEMARCSHNTLRTVRFYEEEGILRPVKRTDGGHRLFTRRELERLLLVTDMRAAGLSLEEIKHILEIRQRAASCGEAAQVAYEILAKRIGELEEKVSVLTRLQEDLAQTSGIMANCIHCNDNRGPSPCSACVMLASTPTLPRSMRVLWSTLRADRRGRPMERELRRIPNNVKRTYRPTSGSARHQ